MSDHMESVNCLEWLTTKKSYVREQSISHDQRDKDRPPAASDRFRRSQSNRSIRLMLRHLIEIPKSLGSGPFVTRICCSILLLNFNEPCTIVTIPTISIYNAQLHLVLRPQFMLSIKIPELQIVNLNIPNHAHLPLVSKPIQEHKTPAK